MAKLKAGSTVRLKTGTGPLMVIEKIDGEHANCMWFDDKHEVKRGTFLVTLLYDPFASNAVA